MRSREKQRERRQRRVRKRMLGTPERPRLNVFRSLSHVHAQLVIDTDGKTVASASSLDKTLRANGAGGTVAGARKVGKLIGSRALEAGYKKVVFDRAGYLYHGRVRALADGAREAGLEF